MSEEEVDASALLTIPKQGDVLFDFELWRGDICVQYLGERKKYCVLFRNNFQIAENRTVLDTVAGSRWEQRVTTDACF